MRTLIFISLFLLSSVSAKEAKKETMSCEIKIRSLKVGRILKESFDLNMIDCIEKASDIRKEIALSHGYDKLVGSGVKAKVKIRRAVGVSETINVVIKD